MTLPELGELNRGKSKHRPRDAAHLYGGPYPFLQTGDIKNARGRVTAYSQTYSEAGLAQSRLWPEGTVAITIAANIAETSILTFPACFPDSVVGFVADPTRCDARFIEYSFQLLRKKIQGEYVGSGSVQDNINLRVLSQLKFLVPPLWEQKAIAEILGSLDDKIELNRRMNETLERTAQAIFRDWFLDFGPTRRKIDGATDPVEIMGGLVADPDRARELAALFPASIGSNGLPEGWEEKPLGNVFDVVMGQSPPGSTYNEAGNGLPFFQGRRDFGFRFPEERVYCTDPSRIANADWTLVSVRAPVGDVNRATTRCCIGRGVAAVCHKADLRSFTYYAVLALKPELARFDGDGTVFGSINQKQMKAFAVVGADYPVAQEFENIAAPIDGLIRSRTEEARTLATTRDLLLPKLMSGEIRLREAEIKLQAAQ